MRVSVLHRILLGLLLVAGAPGLRAQFASPTNALDYFIIITGGELLAGVFPDAHTHYITRTLTPLGGHCVGSITVDDRAEDIQDALHLALARAPLAIVTGGLGPTENDITRQTLSSYTKVSLIENEELIRDMERRHNTTREKLRPNMRRQTHIPERGTYLPCPNGTAAGLVFDLSTNVIVALPGPPRELQPMVKSSLVPWLVKRYGIRPQACSLTMRFVGAGQSLISQTLKDNVPLPADVMQISLFEGGRVDYTFSLPGDTPENRSRLKTIEQEIKEHLKEYLYADDGSSLEDVIIKQMRQHSLNLGLVEIGSGGVLTAALSGATNAADILKGTFTASSREAVVALMGNTEPGNLPADYLEQLAKQAQNKTHGKWVLVTGEIQKSDDKPSRIPVCLLKSGAPARSTTFTAPSNEAASKAHLVTQVLDFIRKEINQ